MIKADLTGSVSVDRTHVTVEIGQLPDGSENDVSRSRLSFPIARVDGGEFDPAKPVTVTISQ